MKPSSPPGQDRGKSMEPRDERNMQKAHPTHCRNRLPTRCDALSSQNRKHSETPLQRWNEETIREKSANRCDLNMRSEHHQDLDLSYDPSPPKFFRMRDLPRVSSSRTRIFQVLQDVCLITSKPCAAIPNVSLNQPEGVACGLACGALDTGSWLWDQMPKQVTLHEIERVEGQGWHSNLKRRVGCPNQCIPASRRCANRNQTGQ